MMVRKSNKAAGVVDRIISQGPVTAAIAERVKDEFPEVSQSLVSWIRDAANECDWSRVGRFSNLAAALRVVGLSEVLSELLDRGESGLNEEDLVDILGEVKAVESAGVIFRTLRRRLDSDSPAYWLSQKAIFALSELETDEANKFLEEMTKDGWPGVIRWHAAVALRIEVELGFDEDAMLG
ncbi:hypothetical protein [Micromonospora rosaria]|uniref:hypothetical protein n=1 Tax=Micromonospora rosaria TaxID=47874 RepID=UPI000B2BA33B|nr:hypothetical protein [Micromonospora rosaria]